MGGFNTAMIEGNIIEDFRQTVDRGNQISDALGDGTDMALHSLFKNGVFDDVPVFGLFAKACNVISDIQAYRFCKKIYKFLFYTQNYNRKAMNSFWEEYSAANKENGYEMMLSVLDKVDNINKVEVMANLLKAKLDGKLTIDNFIRLTSSLQIVPYVDLKCLPDYVESIGTRYDTYMLLAAGLLYNSEIGVDGVGKDDGSRYQLNDNGLLFVKYGLGVDVSQCVKSESPIPTATEADIHEMWEKAMEDANKNSIY